jgi:hypothetical protein
MRMTPRSKSLTRIFPAGTWPLMSCRISRVGASSNAWGKIEANDERTFKILPPSLLSSIYNCESDIIPSQGQCTFVIFFLASQKQKSSKVSKSKYFIEISLGQFFSKSASRNFRCKRIIDNFLFQFRMQSHGV